MFNYDMVKKQRPFKQVFVMGMYHTGTCALIRELTNRYRNPIFPKGINELNENRNWKHEITLSPYKNNNNVLVIVLIKDPFFWFQSLKRNKKDLVVKTRNDLAGNIIFNGRGYKNATELWNQSVTNYLDKKLFPISNTLILKYEEFLFQYQETLHLLDTLLLVKPGLTNQVAINTKAHPHEKCHNRLEALEHYQSANRYKDLSKDEMASIILTVSRSLLDYLDYETQTFPIISLPLTRDNLHSLIDQEPFAREDLITKALSSKVSVNELSDSDSDSDSLNRKDNRTSNRIKAVIIKEDQPELDLEVPLEAKTAILVDIPLKTMDKDANSLDIKTHRQTINPILFERNVLEHRGSLASLYRALRK